MVRAPLGPANVSLVSWPSALQTLSGHRDLKVVLFWKPHEDGAWHIADTHEMNK